MTRPSWIGYTLGGRYQIEALLGQGGMSAVYRAHDPNLRRSVAVKLIHSHLSNDQEFVRRFETEAAAIAQLRHPNIVQVYDFDHDGDTYYMVMEFVPGESLQERLKALNAAGQRLPVPHAAGLMATVCDAVAYAHTRGMIHRDLKPANVMLMANDQPVLTDFGVAKILGSQQHTATGAVLGTPMYMSPEQVQGLPQDARTDLYSIGIMLYEMAAGRPPYEGDSAITIMLKHVNEPLPDLRLRASDVPASLKDIIQRALAKQPADRFQDGAELAASLRAVALAPGSATAAPPPLPISPGEATMAPTDHLATQIEGRPVVSDRTMIERTAPLPAVPPVPVRPPPRPQPQPQPRPAQSSTVLVTPEDAAAARPPWPEPEPVLPPRRRSPIGLILGIGVVLLLCLMLGGVAAVLGGPALMAALLGTPAGAATEAPATATGELAGETLVAPTEAEATEAPTAAPTEEPTVEPTVEPTAAPTDVPVPEGMALIPAGSFSMGTGSGDSAPVHPVTLDAFYLDVFEVTNARYQACVSAGGCTGPRSNNSFTRSGYFTNPSFAEYPVVNVTWNQADAFCASDGKRLPTEAEWEYAAGSGQGQPYPWGATFDAGRTTVTQGDTVQVGSFPNGANTFGVFDLSGNAIEWVADWYQADYYVESPENNPPGPAAGTLKVLRGGSFGNPDPTAYLSTRRFNRAPTASDVDIGFRCAQSVP